MSREVSGGGLAHQGHTPSTSGSRASRCVFRALSSANVRNRMVATVRAVGERDMIGIPTDRASHLMTEAVTAIKVTPRRLDVLDCPARNGQEAARSWWRSDQSTGDRG
jgi:hypothetical protein